MLIFIDTSYYDRIVDWGTYSWDGMFCKISEGTYKDSLFSEQWNAAKGKTIRSPYTFFRPKYSNDVAVHNILNWLGDDPGELPLVVDLETDDSLPPTQVVANLFSFVKTYRRLSNRIPIIYSSPGFINHLELRKYNEFKDYSLWLAQYPWDLVSEQWTEEKRQNKIRQILDRPNLYVFPSPPSPFVKLDWMQWTGKCPPEYVPGYPLGFKKAVDVSFYRYDMPTLFKAFDIKYVPRKEDEMTDTVTLTANLKTNEKSNLRATAGLSGGLLTPQLVGPLTIQGIGQRVYKDNYWWIEIISPRRGWVALTTSYENVKRLDIQPTEKKVTKTTIYFDDNTSMDTFPQS